MDLSGVVNFLPVPKMRWNLRKLIGISIGLVLLWFLLFYSSTIVVQRVSSKNRLKEAELRLNKLQRHIDSQVLKTNRLLEKVKKLKTDSLGEDYANGRESEYASGASLVLPVLVIACDRVTVKRCLDNLVRFRPNKGTFPIIVSQDCGHRATHQVIKSFTDSDPSITLIKQPDLSEIQLPPTLVKFRGYYNIARHFRFALNYVLDVLGHEAVIIVEDDLDISPDFFEYFLGTYPILLKDPSVWCISAWNDNGKQEVIDTSRPELLHRTDFFPGLGWLLRRRTWAALEPHWPPGFFDDWLRDPVNTQGKSCIRPEISRTYTFGKVGVSKGQYFDVHLRGMHLNTEFVEFTKLNLSYLLKDKYDDALTSTVYSLPVMKAEQVISSRSSGDSSPVRVPYSDAKSFRAAAKKLGLMNDFRSGIPRTAYRGIVTCYVHGRRVYLAPDFEWIKYDPKWG